MAFNFICLILFFVLDLLVLMFIVCLGFLSLLVCLVLGIHGDHNRVIYFVVLMVFTGWAGKI